MAQGGATKAVMSEWRDFESAAAELADRIQGRFERHRHAVMATLRRDGSPRLSGMEAPIRDGRLWLAMDATSHKADDLRRDPRFSLHSAPDHEDLLLGDARIEGLAVEAQEEEVDLFIKGHRFPIEDSSTMTLFTGHVTRVILTWVEGEALLVESWTPEGGPKITRRP